MSTEVSFSETQRTYHLGEMREKYSGENRIDRKFKELGNKKALVTFITGGHYGYDTTEKLVMSMEKAGADIIEIGVPFSDPIAEGIVIQNSSSEALSQGTTLAGIFECVKNIRQKTEIPILLMLYINSVFAFGVENFFQNCQDCGIDGIIVPDLPFEEYEEISEISDVFNVHSIHLVAPTSNDRITNIVNNAKGFIYCVSSTGVTGVRSKFKDGTENFIKTVEKKSDIPVCVGFGISTPEQAQKMSAYCDGVIVGSAIVKLVLQYGENSPEYVEKFTNSLRVALDNNNVTL
jgi:tryptophan synthase alpha chain